MALAKLALSSKAWIDCPTNWRAPFLPASTGAWADYPPLEDLFIYNGSGVMPGRTWIISKCFLRRCHGHDKLAGLQVADAVASSLYAAVNLNRYGNVEDKYAKLLSPTFYRHKATYLGYGLKFWPEDLAKLKEANPHLAVFASGD